MRIESPGGAWAEPAPVLTHRMKYEVESLFTRARRADEAGQELPDVIRSFILIFIASWSLGELSEAGIDGAPAELVDALFEGALKAYRADDREATELPQA